MRINAPSEEREAHGVGEPARETPIGETDASEGERSADRTVRLSSEFTFDEVGATVTIKTESTDLSPGR